MAFKVGLIIPCYNEEEILPETIKVISRLMTELLNAGKIKTSSKVYFVDDGSADQTWEIIENASQQNEMIAGFKLSRNFGHQNALLAGMSQVPEDLDCIITLDCDLQDDPQAIKEMLTLHEGGKEIVYGVRDDRTTDSFFKRNTAKLYYKILRSLSIPTINNHADYRLIGRKALFEFKKFNEINLFLRGIIPLLGYETGIVYYTRNARKKGESKYPLFKMISFAWQGITSFSTFPLTFIFYASLASFTGSILLIAWVFYIYLVGKSIPGWSSILIPILMFSGLQGMFLGIIGQYVGKIYMEVKSRPRFIIETSSTNIIKKTD